LTKFKFIFLLIFPLSLFGQDFTFIKGYVKNSKNEPIENVSVSFNKTGTTTNADGFYQLRVPLNQEITLVFTHISHKTLSKSFLLKRKSIVRFSPKLILKTEQLEEIVIKDKTKSVSGVTKIDVGKAKNIVGPNSGVENVLMTLPGVNNNNELSTQYNVRGGNFDENLVYVNGIQVYRPFLIRSGQQEGLSFINTNMIQNINFSAGGFQARFGDRLSSVLDITYRKPSEETIQVDASFLGGSLTYGNSYSDNKLSVLLGARYRDNSLFVNSKQVETNFRPVFSDIQSYISYDWSNKFTLNFLGNLSINDYNYQPLTRRTRFGTVADPLELIVFYEGQEKDSYFTLFGALSGTYKVSEDFSLTTTVSRYNTQEEEHFDIAAFYRLGEVDSSLGSENFGEVEFSQGIGSQINHARNDLDVLITSAEIRATLKKDQSQWNFGVKFQKENIKDRIREWEIIDSLGFSIRPPSHSMNNQPYEPFEGEITSFQSIRTENLVDINRMTAFAQYNKRAFWGDHEVWYNLGVRSHMWNVNGNGMASETKMIISPRVQFAIKPDWEKDMLFRLSGGLYAQPPSYRELRDFNGNVNVNVDAQEAIHIVGGMDYSFQMWNRPFKLTSEVYYKSLSNLNAYSIDNVRIRYRADNVTEGYAYGLDLRLNGEFVPGSESWVSIGYLKTAENQDNRGYIARPTDQRLKFAILFQDYVPNLPDLKAYLNLVYNTGVPGGSPAYSDVYQFQDRLRDYRRADLGVSYVFVDSNKQFKTGWLSKFKELTAGLELFNMFDIQNAITNTWVRDVYSKRQYGIPNFMTGRVLNFKMSMQF
jgi:hypothetical protein